MLDGWYCRTLANEQQAAQQNDNTEPNTGLNDDTDSDSQEIDESRLGGGDTNRAVDYKEQYRYLKKKFKFLIYENEFFQDALRSNQRRLLKVSKDRAFLLDRLLQYEKPENTSSESEETEESSEEEASKEIKKRKLEQSVNGTTCSTRGRKRKNPATSTTESVEQIPNSAFNNFDTIVNQQTQEEVERQLSKRSVMDLIPERAPATVPVEMFSNEPSLDSEPADHLVEGSSPTHVAAEECVPMEYSN